MGMNIASSAISFGSTLEESRATQNALKRNAKVADINADITQQQGEASNQALNRSIQGTLGSIRAGYGSSGIDMSQGSPLDVLASSIRAGTLDSLTQKYNYGIQVQSYRDQAALLRNGAKNAQAAGFVQAIANGMNGMTSGQVNTGGYGSNTAGTGNGAMFVQGGNSGGFSGAWSSGNSLTGGSYVPSGGGTAQSWSPGGWM